MGSNERFFAAIEAGDAELVRSMVSADPSVAAARDGQGVSALMPKSMQPKSSHQRRPY